jgi:hypothetical protein
MAWRLYDPVNGTWYNDDVYDIREACEAAATHYMQEDHDLGGELALIVESVDPNEPFESVRDVNEGS